MPNKRRTYEYFEAENGKAKSTGSVFNQVPGLRSYFEFKDGAEIDSVIDQQTGYIRLYPEGDDWGAVKDLLPTLSFKLDPVTARFLVAKPENKIVLGNYKLLQWSLFAEEGDDGIKVFNDVIYFQHINENSIRTASWPWIHKPVKEKD